MVPKKIGHYEVARELGQGGMSTVYLARDTNLDIDVAIKVLPRQLTFDEQFSARFRREAKIIAALKHPAVVRVYNFGEADEQLYLVMEYMSGGSLRDRLNKRKRFSVSEALRLLEQIGPALSLAHSRGIVHRDLKPENILFDDQGAAYIADFGIAKLIESKSLITTIGLIGTPAYMSSEQASGESQLDGRSDQYSLAVVLFEALTGRPLFKADTPRKMLHAHMDQPPVDIRTLRKGLPAELSAFFNQAFDKDPRNRFTSMDEMMATFRSAVTAGGTVKVPPQKPETSKKKRLQKERNAGMRKVLARLAANPVLLVGLAALMLTLAVLWTRQPPDATQATQTAGAELAALTAPTDTPAPTLTNVPTVQPTAESLPQVISVSNVSQLEQVLELSGDGTPITDIAFSPDGFVLASVSSNNVTKLLRLETGDYVELIGTTPRNNASIRVDLDFSSDGSLLAVGSEQVSIWDVQQQVLLDTLPGLASTSYKKHIGTSRLGRGLAFSPDDAMLAAWSTEFYSLQIWSPRVGTLLQELYVGGDPWAYLVDFSLSGNYLAIVQADSKSIKFWQRNSGGAFPRVFSGWINLNSEPTSLAFMPNDAGIVLGFVDGSLKLLKLSSEPEYLTDFSGHISRINSIALSPDGGLLVSGGSDGKVIVWSALDGTLLTEIYFAGTEVSAVDFSPDGDLIAAASSDGNVRIFGLPGSSVASFTSEPKTTPDTEPGTSGTSGDLDNSNDAQEEEPFRVALRNISSTSILTLFVNGSQSISVQNGGDFYTFGHGQGIYLPAGTYNV